MVGLVGGTTFRSAAADFFAAPSKDEGRVGWCLSACAFLLVISFALALAPAKFAWAEDLDMYPVADEFQQEVERTAAEYDSAREKLAQAEADIQENTVRIDELSAEIPQQQQRGAVAARELYKIQQQGAGLLQMLLESDDFYGFLANLEYLTRISDSHGQELQKLADMQDELETRQVALEKAHSSAAKQEKKAKEALVAAQEARLEAQQRAQEEARRQAEEAAAAEAAAQAAAEAEAAEAAKAAQDDAAEKEAAQAEETEKQKEPDKPEEGSASEAADEPSQNAPQEEPAPAEEEQAGSALEQPTEDGADWTSDQAAFINEWSARIDGYLAGSPLSGQGATFAKAAWDYGVDPRWSPAIAFTESSLGANCFNPYNAWGWGSASWGSWEEAIPAHVAGLARGYGYTITIEAAQKYCPPNWEAWYNRTLEQMNAI
ncbi:MAG: hypothetical protein IJI68_05895 [Eggerthellaceae bacterium]|nr:hypothetical protein [Eggerthellaceae bacterium]